MPRRPRSEVEQSTTALLEDAASLASLEGLESLTIGRMAQRAGLSKSGLLGRFGTKEALQLATIQAGIETFIEEVVAPALRHERGLPRLRALSAAHISYLEREVFPGGCFLMAAAHEFDGRPGPVRDAVHDAWARWLDRLELEARRAGHPEPRQLAFELNSLALGANWAHQLLGDRGAFRRARAAHKRLLADPEV